MTETETIERIALAYVNQIRAARGALPVATLGALMPFEGAVNIAKVNFILSALRPGDVLPGGMMVISRSQFAAVAFAATQAEASGKPQSEVNKIVKETMAKIEATTHGAYVLHVGPPATLKGGE